MTLTPGGDASHTVSETEQKTTRELVIRISVFALLTTVAVAASVVIAYFNERLGIALGVGAAVLAAIYAVKTFSKK